MSKLSDRICKDGDILFYDEASPIWFKQGGTMKLSERIDKATDAFMHHLNFTYVSETESFRIYIDDSNVLNFVFIDLDEQDFKDFTEEEYKSLRKKFESEMIQYCAKHMDDFEPPYDITCSIAKYLIFDDAGEHGRAVIRYERDVFHG